MKREDFIKGAGMAGLVSFLPTFGLGKKNKPATNYKVAENTCTLIPSETAGPFPLDLTANTAFFRQDIRENKTGVQLNVKLKILGLANCGPMQNVRVNIWHCSKDGLYSGYDNAMNAGQAGLTYLRGYQITDANGEVEFVTILPGWYSGRICHIHFQVYVSSSYSAISQFTFPIAEKNAIYAANSSLYTKGADPMTFSSDNIFSDGYSLQLATLTANTSTGGYDTYFEATVQGTGATVGTSHLEKETEKQFVLGQNFPNPYRAETTIPFILKNPADVELAIYDLSGKKVSSIERKNLGAGEHTIPINLAALGLPVANYAYQMEVTNSNGTFINSKLMTAAK